MTDDLDTLLADLDAALEAPSEESAQPATRLENRRARNRRYYQKHRQALLARARAQYQKRNYPDAS